MPAEIVTKVCQLGRLAAAQDREADDQVLIFATWYGHLWDVIAAGLAHQVYVGRSCELYVQ